MIMNNAIKFNIIFTFTLIFLMALSLIGRPTASKEKWLWALCVGILTWITIILVFWRFS
jgi:hypothetical protein